MHGKEIPKLEFGFQLFDVLITLPSRCLLYIARATRPIANDYKCDIVCASVAKAKTRLSYLKFLVEKVCFNTIPSDLSDCRGGFAGTAGQAMAGPHFFTTGCGS